MLSAQKGYTLPALLLIVALIISLPLYTVVQNKWAESGIREVQGVSSNRAGSDSKYGFTTKIRTTNDTWTLTENLCKTLEECVESMESGTKFAILNGAHVEEHEIVINYSPSWKDFEYLKIYVKEGLNTNGRNKNYMVSDEGEIPNQYLETFTQNERTVTTVIIPLETLRKGFHVGPTFTSQN